MEIVRNILFVIGILLAACVGGVLFSVLQSLQWRWHFEQLVKTNDHAAVARAAITLMRGAADKDVLTGGHDLASLPPVIAGMKPKYVSFSSNYLTIEFHGGFDHFGFKVADRGKSWALSWYTEEERHTLLSIAKDEPEQASPPMDKSNISKQPR